MGISGYGLLSIYSVISPYCALVDLGISKNLLRTLSANRDVNEQTTNIRIAYGVYIIMCAILILLTPLIIYVIENYIFKLSIDNTSALRLIIALAIVEYVLTIPILLMQNYCLANENFDSYSKFNLFSGIYRYALILSVLYFFPSPVAVVSIMAFRRIIDFFTAKKIMGKLPAKAWQPIFDLKMTKSIIGHSSALTLAQLFQLSFIALGSFLMNKHFGLSGLGIYRAVFDLATKIWFFSNGLSLVLFPKFALLLSSKESRLRLASIVMITLYLSWSGYGLLCVVSASASFTIMNILGLTQPEMPTMFAVLLLGVCINAHTCLSNELLQAAGRYRIVALLNFIALICMLISFNFSMNLSGLYAISWAWVISQSIYSILLDGVALYELHLRITSQFKLIVIKLLILTLPLLSISRIYSTNQTIFNTINIALATVIFVICYFHFKRRSDSYNQLQYNS